MAARNLLALAALAICPRLLLAGECAAGANPFPSNLAGSGLVSHADLFEVRYYDTYKVISFDQRLATYKSYHPTKAGQPIPPIVLHQCGTTKPSVGDAGVSDTDSRFFEIPIQRASLAWGGAVTFFEMLGVTEFIHAIDMTYISSPCTQLMEVCDPSIHMKGGSAEFKAYHQALVPENGSVVFSDSFGTGFSDSIWDVEFMVSVDPGILNRAAWVNFVAAFFNLEAEGAQIFSNISEDYNNMKAIGQQLAGDSNTEWGGRAPKVAWTDSQPETCPNPSTNCNSVGWTQVDGSWCHCGVLYKISTALYKKDMVEDAGGQLVALPTTASMPSGCSTATNTDGSATLTCDPSGHGAFVDLIAEADVIFDESRLHGGTDSYDITVHDFAGAYGVNDTEVPALARDPPNIFRLDGSVSDARDGTRGSNWFEGSKAQPQQLIAGMMEALWGDKFHSSCGNKYLRLAIPGEGQEVLGHHNCSLYDEGGNHDCATIHQLLHEIPQCCPSATATQTTQTATATTVTTTTATAPATNNDESVSSAGEVGLSVMAAFVALCGL